VRGSIQSFRPHSLLYQHASLTDWRKCRDFAWPGVWRKRAATFHFTVATLCWAAKGSVVSVTQRAGDDIHSARIPPGSRESSQGIATEPFLSHRAANCGTMKSERNSNKGGDTLCLPALANYCSWMNALGLRLAARGIRYFERGTKWLKDDVATTQV
jgi:hypothetical protein